MNKKTVPVKQDGLEREKDYEIQLNIESFFLYKQVLLLQAGTGIFPE